jgi:hypothetical protein
MLTRVRICLAICSYTNTSIGIAPSQDPLLRIAMARNI